MHKATKITAIITLGIMLTAALTIVGSLGMMFTADVDWNEHIVYEGGDANVTFEGSGHYAVYVAKDANCTGSNMTVYLETYEISLSSDCRDGSTFDEWKHYDEFELGNEVNATLVSSFDNYVIVDTNEPYEAMAIGLLSGFAICCLSLIGVAIFVILYMVLDGDANKEVLYQPAPVNPSAVPANGEGTTVSGTAGTQYVQAIPPAINTPSSVPLAQQEQSETDSPTNMAPPLATPLTNQPTTPVSVEEEKEERNDTFW